MDRTCGISSPEVLGVQLIIIEQGGSRDVEKTALVVIICTVGRLGDAKAYK